MMRALSWPDVRDSMSLPFEAIDWDNWDTPLSQLDGVRIGLLLDAGCGLPVDAEVQSAVLRAARLFEGTGAIVTPMQPFLTRQMLDGMDHAWRMRSHLDLSALSEARRATVLPISAPGPTALAACRAPTCSAPPASSTPPVWPR
jgi:Asp-tRNA(Asn)/Glu-tRNA(Gln) amidotransferase A subunit family amidase